MKLIAIIDPDGVPVRWSIRPQPEGRARNVRRGLRRSAEAAYGEKWRALWLRGFKVGAVDPDGQRRPAGSMQA